MFSAIWAVQVLARKVQGFPLVPLVRRLAPVAASSVVMAQVVWLVSRATGSDQGLGAVARWLLAERHPVGSRPPWAADRTEDDQDWPEAVAAAAQAGDSLAQEALNLWLGAYGSVTGDLALSSLSMGGIWVAGGTAAKQIEGLRSPTFLEPFLAKGRLRAVLEPVPIQAITDPAVGVFGAACRAGLRLI